MKLVIFFDVLLNPTFQKTTRFANVARTQLPQVNSYIRKCFKNKQRQKGARGTEAIMKR